jgi:hypothetical protein
LRSLGLDSLPGEIPVYHAHDVAATEAAEVQQLMRACVERYRAEIPGIPAITVAILDSATWTRVTPAPYGIPHHRPDLTPAVVIVPARPAAVVASIGLSAAEAPRFFRLLALHELGQSQSAPLATDAIVRDFARSNPELVPWLRSLGAIR